jgi:hypothetical protein
MRHHDRRRKRAHRHNPADFMALIGTKVVGPIRHITVDANCLASNCTTVSADNHEKSGRVVSLQAVSRVLESIHNKDRQIMLEQKYHLEEPLITKELLNQSALYETAEWYSIKFLHSGS